MRGVGGLEVTVAGKNDIVPKCHSGLSELLVFECEYYLPPPPSHTHTHTHTHTYTQAFISNERS
jgi:hypothetical protein